MTEKKLSMIAIVAVISVALLSGCQPAPEQTASLDTGETQQTLEIPVEVAEVAEGVLDGATNVIGEVDANLKIDIISKASGVVQEITVEKGASVAKNQVIAKLDQKDYILGLRQAEAALETALAGLKQSQYANGVGSAESSLDLAKRSLEIAQKNYDRIKELVEANAAAQTQLEQAEGALIQAKNQYNMAMQGTASIDVAKAQVNQAQVGLDRAKAALDDTNIRATANGYITNVYVEPGETINPGMPVASLINIDPAIIRLNVSEINRSKFKEGSELEISVPAQGLSLKGKVSYVGLQADPQTKMYPIEISVSNKEQLLLPGMNVEVAVKDLESKKGLLIPTVAIVEQDGKKFVYVIEGNKAVKREVVLAEGNSSKVIVLDGLKAGEQVVIKGQNNLSDQAAVRIVK